MKVRATQDGHYGGYYRYGPIVAENGNFDGEIFEIDARPFPVSDENGKPVFETNENGKIILDENKKPKVKMATHFSPIWMEQVSDEMQTTYDYPPFEIPIQYRDIKKRGQGSTGLFVPTPGAPGGQSKAPLI